MSSEPRFSDAESALYGALAGRGDVAIADLYRVVTSVSDRAAARSSLRRQQQLVGAYVSRLNDKIRGRGEVVRPGDARRTYRLDARATA